MVSCNQYEERIQNKSYSYLISTLPSNLHTCLRSHSHYPRNRRCKPEKYAQLLIDHKNKMLKRHLTHALTH